MCTKPLSVTPISFEKLFAAIVTSHPLRSPSRSGKTALSSTDWRQLASAALQRNSLGDSLRRAIDALSAKYREVLFLQDVKNLNTAETAWVLDLSAKAVRSLLRKAREQVRNALSSALLSKPSAENSRRKYSQAHALPGDFHLMSRGNSLRLA